MIKFLFESLRRVGNGRDRSLRFLLPTVLLLCACTQQKGKQPDLTNAHWQPQDSGISASFRGISAVDEKIAWVSGTNGSCLRTVDGGLSWQAATVPGADSLDFRDVHAVDENRAYLMSAGPGKRSRIYKTIDGGQNWQLQFLNTIAEGFLDGIAFWDEKTGLAYGDPLERHLFILKTTNGGATWHRIANQNIPPVTEGEYSFAASGTGIAVHGKNAWISTGGAAARVFRSTDRGETWTVVSTPFVNGESAGIFSLAFREAQNGIAIGGDYRKPDAGENNLARTTDGGQTWTLVKGHSVEYRSCVQYIPGTLALVSVGPSGSDISVDDGLTWAKLDTLGYHTLSFAPGTKVGWAAGADGRIAKFDVR